jgi:hypothetical protein
MSVLYRINTLKIRNFSLCVNLVKIYKSQQIIKFKIIDLHYLKYIKYEICIDV